jgi:hypothetical protein
MKHHPMTGHHVTSRHKASIHGEAHTGHPHHRAKGGGIEHDEDMVEEAREEERNASKTGEEAEGATEKKEMKTGEELKHGGRMKKRNHGGKLEAMVEKERHKRKRGGHVPGHHPKGRPDRRARGGATSDLNPTTAAGNMSQPGYLKKLPFDNGGGSMGKDSRGLYGRD